MNNHFTVTIHDDNGVRQFNVHKIIKRFTFYILMSFGAIAMTAIGTILYLNNSVDATNQKRLDMKKAYNVLKKNAESIEKDLEIKKEELLEVSDSLSEIELMIGIQTSIEVPLKERVNMTKLSSVDMATLLQIVPSGFPIANKGITSKFGYRVHPISKSREYHRGIDLRAKMKTPVYATADGIIEYAGYYAKSGYGNLVIIQHNYGFKTYFGHLNKIVVESGKFIKKGDLIAYSGNSGRSNGPHLHYEVRFISRSINPHWFNKWSITNYKDIFKKEKTIPWQSLITATAHLRVQIPTQTLPLSLTVQKLREN